MVIKLNEIPTEGLLIQLNQEDRRTSQALQDLLMHHPFEVEACILPIDQGYELYGKITGQRTLECSFCLCQFKQPFCEKFHDIYLKTKAKIAQNLQMSDVSSDISVFPLKSMRFSFSDFLHEILVLATDFQVLCKKDCKGLCCHCGKNLNHEKCTCSSLKGFYKQSNPFSALLKR